MTSLPAEHAALFQALAQIAVAFAGFAGVVGSFSRFSTDARVTAFRVRGMVALSLFALLAALAPLAVASFGANASGVWRIASGFTAILGVLLFASLLRAVLPLFRQKLLHTEALNVVWYGLAALMIISLVICAAGFMSVERGGGVYVASVIFLLLLCAYNFQMLILSILFDGAP